MYLIHDGWYNVVRVQVFGPNKPPAKWCWRLRLVLSVGDRLALTHQQLPHALRLPTQHLYFWRHGVLKKETRSGMPSAGLAITPYKTKNVYVPMDTHRLQTPPPSANKCVTCARSVRVCACVCALRARVRTIRAGARARAPYARTARAHCTCSPYARAVREPYARTVRKKCAPKSAVSFFQNLLPFVENLLRFFKICYDF